MLSLKKTKIFIDSSGLTFVNSFNLVNVTNWIDKVKITYQIFCKKLLILDKRRRWVWKSDKKAVPWKNYDKFLNKEKVWFFYYHKIMISSKNIAVPCILNFFQKCLFVFKLI